MKKFFSICLSVLILLSCCSFLYACGEHEHSGITYGNDQTHHWYICDGCETPFDITQHVFKEELNDDFDIVKTCLECNFSFVDIRVEEHAHDYSGEYVFNDAFHYVQCAFENCIMQSEKEEHIFGTPEIVQEVNLIIKTYKCEVCDYKKVVETTINSIISGQKEWNDAFNNLTMTNFEMKVDLGSEIRHCIVTQNGAYINYGDYQICYTQKDENNQWTTYIGRRAKQNEAFNWYLIEEKEDLIYSSFVRSATIEIKYVDTFNNFTYNSERGEYLCKDILECKAYYWGDESGAVATEYRLINCFNNVIKAIDGKISFIQANYYFEDEASYESPYSFMYYNIGIAEFKIPQTVIDNAVSISWGDSLNPV